MAGQVEQLSAAVAALAHAWADAVPAGLNLWAAESAAVREMADPDLVAVLGAVGEVTKRVEALGAVVAGEISRRSPREAGSQGLARRFGFSTPGRMVADSHGGRISRALDLVRVGEATNSRHSLTGDVLPAAHPHVAAGLQDGRFGVDAAQLIVSMLDRVAPRANPQELEATEKTLASQAGEFPLAQLERLVKYAEARLDPDGLAPKEEDQYAARSLTMREDSRGMFHLRGVFDPITGAPIKLALEAYAQARLREARGANAPGETQDAHTLPTMQDARPGEALAAQTGEALAAQTGEALAAQPADAEDARTGEALAAHTGETPNLYSAGTAKDDSAGHPAAPKETRTIAQLQADALSDFVRHVRGCDKKDFSIPNVTMVVRVDLEDLEDRLAGGICTIDGIDQPLSASAARQLAARANLIPAVFGTQPLPLDMGRIARTFTPTQTLALWERDGGCAMCGQRTFVEAHHIRWWWRHLGPTDLSNGVLLCTRCHHLIHRDEWDIEINAAGEVWFHPPAHIDPGRQPRRAAANPARRAPHVA